MRIRKNVDFVPPAKVTIWQAFLQAPVNCVCVCIHLHAHLAGLCRDISVRGTSKLAVLPKVTPKGDIRTLLLLFPYEPKELLGASSRVLCGHVVSMRR
jgi:hypothetical protein